MACAATKDTHNNQRGFTWLRAGPRHVVTGWHIQIGLSSGVSREREDSMSNLPKIQEKRPNLRVFRQKDANGITNSEDPDQTAPLGAV